MYPILGLCGEVGEVAELAKKYVRNGNMTEEEFVNAMKRELGDVLWYIAAFAGDLGFTLEDVAETNLRKLSDRASRGVLRSTGDDR